MRGSGIWLKHLNSSGWNTNGTERFYFRPKKERSPFPKEWRMPAQPPHHPAFLSAYAKAWDLWVAMQDGEVVKDPVYAGSLAEAAVGYKGSHAFGLLAEITRQRYRAMLENTVDLYGKAQVEQVQRKHVQKDLSRFDGHAQINHLKMWRSFAKYFVVQYALDLDPTDNIKRAATAKTDGHTPWQTSDVIRFRNHFDLQQPVRLAFELLQWTGMRCVDLVRLGRGNITDDGWLHFKQSKTGGPVYVPLHRDLPDFALGMIEDQQLCIKAIQATPKDHLTFMVTSRGASRSEKSVSSWFSKKAKQAGLADDLTAHGLRKFRAIQCAEANATVPQMMAWTGHESLSEVQAYIKKFSKKAVLTSTRQEPKAPTFL